MSAVRLFQAVSSTEQTAVKKRGMVKPFLAFCLF